MAFKTGGTMATKAGTKISESPVLYSTNTWIAYMIAEQFYRRHHYVWCTPYFDPRQSGRDSAVPPTSSPFEMYRALFEETSRGERHSSKIEQNRVGILRGARAKRRARVITANHEKQIAAIVQAAQPSDFRPLLYVIPAAIVAKRLREPPPEDKAHPLSAEYVIDALPRECFDVIEFGSRP
jgi:hypothetical protein